jgi:hypothetical protein
MPDDVGGAVAGEAICADDCLLAGPSYQERVQDVLPALEGPSR